LTVCLINVIEAASTLGIATSDSIRASARRLLGRKGLVIGIQRKQEGSMDTQSLLVFILLPLLVLATAITFLLLQRARRKRDQGQQ
jgi:hypothetical protein